MYIQCSSTLILCGFILIFNSNGCPWWKGLPPCLSSLPQLPYCRWLRTTQCSLKRTLKWKAVSPRGSILGPHAKLIENLKLVVHAYMYTFLTLIKESIRENSLFSILGLQAKLVDNLKLVVYFFLIIKKYIRENSLLLYLYVSNSMSWETEIYTWTMISIFICIRNSMSITPVWRGKSM